MVMDSRVFPPMILASQSPRRRELLARLDLDFEVVPSNVDESCVQDEDPRRLAERLAMVKARDVAERTPPGALVIGADTVVVVNGRVLGKPATAADAVAMLKTLRARTHTVITGVAITDSGLDKLVSGAELTDVTFRDLGDDEIERYVASGEPMDKAGAYGIQRRGALLVKGINGCYFNVVGLPLGLLADLLQAFEVHIL